MVAPLIAVKIALQGHVVSCLFHATAIRTMGAGRPRLYCTMVSGYARGGHQTCFSWRVPAKDRDFVFTRYAP
jgi:hypothetical protein